MIFTLILERDRKAYNVIVREKERRKGDGGWNFVMSKITEIQNLTSMSSSFSQNLLKTSDLNVL